MAVNKLNILQEEALIKTLHILNGDEFGLGGFNTLNVMRFYPFEQLVQIYGTNREIICYNTQIINKFLESDTFLTCEAYLKPSVNFVLSNLSFILNQEDSLDISNLLLAFLVNLLRRLNEVSSFTITCSLICQITKLILQSDHIKNGTMKENLCYFLIEVVKNTKYHNEQKVDILNCVNIFLMNVQEDLVLGFRLIVEIMRIDEFLKNMKIESIYIFIELSIRGMKMSTDNDTLRNFLESLELVWRNCTMPHYLKRFFLNTIKKLKLLKRCLSETKEIKEKAIEVLILIINHEFKHVALDSHTLKYELNILAKYTNWETANCDIIFVIHYFEFIYLSIRHNKSSIRSKLIKYMVRSFPTSPLLLKTLFLLYGAYVDKHYDRKLSNKILHYLDEVHQLEHLLTLHNSQLLWILWSGKYSLKMKTLKVWLKLHEHSNDILRCLIYTNNLGLVLDILTNPRDALYHGSLIKLLHNSKDFYIRKLLIVTEMKSVPNTIFSQCLINVESLAGNELEVAVLLSKQILCIMKQTQNAEMMEYACSYCYELVQKFRNHFEIIYPYMEPDVIQLLFEIAKSDNDHLADYVLNLFRIVIHLQTTKQLMPREKIELDLSEILVGSTNRLRKALSLINFVTKNGNERSILTLEKPSFGINYKLISLTNGECRKEAFRLLGKIMSKERYLAPTISNKLFVISACDRSCGESNAGFLNFLAMWIHIVKDCVYFNVPKSQIMKYLENVDKEYEYKVYIITKMLDKCYTPTPIPSYSRYFN